jgi:hypothetical protein
MRPPTDPPVPRDPRLDPYRERGGLLFRGDDQVAALYVRVEAWWRQVGGFLWWRKWSAPTEGLTGFLQLADGDFDDFVIFDADELADELAAWNSDRFAYRGETLRVRWLDDAASRSLRAEVFGLDDYVT